MSKAIITESLLSEIGDAIRQKTGATATYTPSQMAEVIASIETGGGGGIIPSGTISIVENGTYDVTNYASAEVNVPTSGTGSSDELVALIERTMTSIENAEVTVIGTSAFRDVAITNASFPNVTEVKNYAFSYSQLVSVQMPSVTSLGQGCFNNCKSLTGFDFTNVIYMGGSCFNNCTSLTRVDIPLVSGISSCFSGCTNLKTVILGSCTNIPNNLFYNCKAFDTLVLRKTDAICTLASVGGIANNTPFSSGGSGGTVYVPAALLETYKTAANWSTVDGYGTITWATIEGSEYE